MWRAQRWRARSTCCAARRRACASTTAHRRSGRGPVAHRARHAADHAAGGRVYASASSSCVPTPERHRQRRRRDADAHFGGHAFCRQGGLELLHDIGFADAAPAHQRAGLGCWRRPTARSAMDLVIAPGSDDPADPRIDRPSARARPHPRRRAQLRRHAASSRSSMFGRYRYGSSCSNVTFDPTAHEQLASYGFDDDGPAGAPRGHRSAQGILLRPLGGRTVAARAGIAGRRQRARGGWNRPPIDRMANLEPRARAIVVRRAGRARSSAACYVETNCSWSIDDSRNKFQFGCEWGAAHRERRAARGGARPELPRRLGDVLAQPGRRSATTDTLQVLGTPWCGKGEPNQVIRVGHASPACLFTRRRSLRRSAAMRRRHLPCGRRRGYRD